MAGGAVPPSAWESNASGAIVHAFHHAYWGDWKFSVDKHDKAAETLHVCMYCTHTSHSNFNLHCICTVSLMSCLFAAAAMYYVQSSGAVASKRHEAPAVPVRSVKSAPRLSFWKLMR